MTFKKTLILCLTLGSLITTLEAAYYRDTLFVIGLTGINRSGYDCPYSSVDVQPPWTWTPDSSTNNEQDLIFDLGVNVIGCQDAIPTYLVDLNPDENEYKTSNYLHQVCANAPDSNPVYIITDAYYVWEPEYSICNTDTLENCKYPCGGDSTGNKSWGNQATSSMFRSPTRGTQPGFGDIQFSAYTNYNSFYNCHGTTTDANWSTFDGGSVWKEQADTAIANFEAFFNRSDNPAQYIWGYNLISEDPACARRMSMGQWNGTNDHWHGCWAGVDYLFTGHKGTTAFPDLGEASHSGFRGAEKNVFGNTRRMIIAKFNPSCLHKKGYNIFQWLPDIDAIVVFWHSWCRAKFNYGEQGLFDNFLYGTVAKEESPLYADKGGFHNNAIYMQQYSNTYLAYSDQKRRWIPYLALEWLVKNDSLGGGVDNTEAKVRRPCPPEIRCAAYLLMSRGAKGILFHGWSFSLTCTDDSTKEAVTCPNPRVDIPSYYDKSGYYNFGIRDSLGYPYDGSKDWHVLNDSTAPAGKTQTYWHDNPRDSTYSYLCHLIPELKLIAPKLMELDWINGYSLKSTSPEWNLPCPHYYVEDVWGVEYADLGFFDHPYEPVGVEYFMMVNREGIADMTNRTVSVALGAQHWPEEDTLILTDIANADTPRKLTREGERYVFTEVFEPGEGKLYRVAPVNEAPVTLVPTADGGEQ